MSFHITDRLLALLLTIALSVLCAGCDYLLKRAGTFPQPFLAREFWLGFAGYGLSAFGWVFALQHLKLATLGAIYCLALIILLAVGGVLVFGETLNRTEVIGLILGCVSILLLARFA